MMSITGQNIEFDEIIRALGENVPDANQYARLSEINISHPLATKLATLDPFSSTYRSIAMNLYLDLRGRQDDGYNPEHDEITGTSGLPADIWRDASPWSFQSSKMASEFLICWGQIMRLLDLPADSTASVLEYGTGSGQLLLFLARMGLDVYAVDIDQPSLNLVAAQATAMGLNVRCERGLFGEGFQDKTFDRVIFFEAFHHAWDFEKLLDRLDERLKPGGKLILCGEPVVPNPTLSVPFPWGPRLDALSVYCMRRYGWMELGFTEDFILQTFTRHGWLIAIHHIDGIGRASAYVARRALGATVKLGEDFTFSKDFLPGWGAPEGTHRWTNGGLAQFPNPSRGSNVIIRFGNYLPVEKHITFQSGNVISRMVVPAGTANCEVTLLGANGPTIDISCEGHRPSDINPDSKDLRSLGIAITEIEFQRS